MIDFHARPPKSLVSQEILMERNPSASKTAGKYNFGNKTAQERYALPENFLEVEVLGV
jgi:hypothetical protein